MDMSLQTTEIYDPLTDSFSAGASMTAKRSSHTATTLLMVKFFLLEVKIMLILIQLKFMILPSNSFSSSARMVVARFGHFSALLPDGRVLIGCGWLHESKQTTEIYDPWTSSFSKGGDLLEKEMLLLPLYTNNNKLFFFCKQKKNI